MKPVQFQRKELLFTEDVTIKQCYSYNPRVFQVHGKFEKVLPRSVWFNWSISIFQFNCCSAAL